MANIKRIDGRITKPGSNPPVNILPCLNTLLNTFYNRHKLEEKAKTRYPLRANGFHWSKRLKSIFLQDHFDRKNLADNLSLYQSEIFMAM
ncbi:hypothetical protein AALA80_17680 [Oscillospiraceae bacterium 50-60]